MDPAGEHGQGLTEVVLWVHGHLTRVAVWVYCWRRTLMSPRLPTPLAALALAALLSPGWGLRADLAAASPFMPASSAAAAALTASNSPIELRGMMTTDQGVVCCIYDVAKKAGTWVNVNETGNDFVVKTANTSDESALVTYQGRTLQLALHTAKVVSSGAPPTGAPPAAGQPAASGPPTPGDEQKRLDAVAAEVRRRRLEREKAFNAQGAGNPGAPAPPNR